MRLLLSLNRRPHHSPSASPDTGVKDFLYFSLTYLLAEQSFLVCKCELSDRCDKMFN